MIEQPTEGRVNTFHSISRTIVLYVLCGVIGWVGLNIQAQNKSINDLNISNGKLEQKVEDLGQSISTSVPQLIVDMAAVKVQVANNDRRIGALEERPK